MIARLEAAGAPPTCFVLAYGNRDGLELPLRPAVATLMAGGAGMLSCVPGRLALYVGEDGSTVLLLTHHAQADRA